MEGKSIQKDAKLAITKAATIFISYLTAAAQDHANEHRIRNMSDTNVMSALEELGFQDIVSDVMVKVENHHRYLSDKVARKAMRSKGEDGQEEAEEAICSDDNQEDASPMDNTMGEVSEDSDDGSNMPHVEIGTEKFDCQ